MDYLFKKPFKLFNINSFGLKPEILFYFILMQFVYDNSIKNSKLGAKVNKLKFQNFTSYEMRKTIKCCATRKRRLPVQKFL